jgi:GTPase SAR1 family protein
MGAVFSNSEEEAKRAAEAQSQVRDAAIRRHLPFLQRYYSQVNNSVIDDDYVMKVVVVGEGGGGKSALLRRIIDDAFEDTNCPTVGISFATKTVVHRSRTVRLQIWDCGTHDEE